MNNKLPGTIATSQFDDTFYEEVNSFMGTSFGDSKLDAKLIDFIEQELKKEREEILDFIENVKKAGKAMGTESVCVDVIIREIKNRT